MWNSLGNLDAHLVVDLAYVIVPHLKSICGTLDLPLRTTRSCLLLRKDKIRPNIWPEIPKDLSLRRRPGCQTLSKALDISSATAQVVPDLLKALAILSNTTVIRSAVDREDLEPYWKSENRQHFSRWPTSLLFKFFKNFTNHRKRINRAVDFSSRPFPNILKHRNHQWDLPAIWKTRLLQTHIEEFSQVCVKVRVHSSSEPSLEDSSVLLWILRNI